MLCRGVLNDLVEDADRERAFKAFASWLRPGGMLLVDVRDLESSRRRYAQQRTFAETAQRDDDVLTFESVTSIQPGSDRLELIERWQGTVAGERVAVKTRFEMRCWTWDVLERSALTAGFRTVVAQEPRVLGAHSDRLVAAALR